CQIATTRRLVHIGGTSAGAIAAGAAAAAEYARATGATPSPDIGYPRLAGLPDTLVAKTGGHTKLYHLFQPQDSTRALYRLVAVWIGRGGKGRKIFGSLMSLLISMLPVPGLIAAVLAIALAVCAWYFSNWLGMVFAAVLIVVVVALTIGWSLWMRVQRDL